MTGIFLLAVTVSFAFKAKNKFAWNASIAMGTPSVPWCTITNTANSCETTYTGPQCTVLYHGAYRLAYELPIPAGGPICVTPLREWQP